MKQSISSTIMNTTKNYITRLIIPYGMQDCYVRTYLHLLQ